jgi:hypothetical protein
MTVFGVAATSCAIVIIRLVDVFGVGGVHHEEALIGAGLT